MLYNVEQIRSLRNQPDFNLSRYGPEIKSERRSHII
jgi:hypothetical protein